MNVCLIDCLSLSDMYEAAYRYVCICVCMHVQVGPT